MNVDILFCSCIKAFYLPLALAYSSDCCWSNEDVDNKQQYNENVRRTKAEQNFSILFMKKIHSFVCPPGNYMQRLFGVAAPRKYPLPIACSGLVMQYAFAKKCSSVPRPICIRVKWHCAQLTNTARCDHAVHSVINDEILTKLCDIASRCGGWSRCLTFIQLWISHVDKYTAKSRGRKDFFPIYRLRATRACLCLETLQNFILRIKNFINKYNAIQVEWHLSRNRQPIYATCS